MTEQKRIVEFLEDGDMRIRTLHEKIEEMVWDFILTERCTLATAIGIIELVKAKILKDSLE